MALFESLEAMNQFISESSLEEFKMTLPNFSYSEIAESILVLQNQLVIESEEKLAALFEFINSPSILELVGKQLSVAHFLSLLQFFENYPSYQNQLTFILAGLDPSVFSQALQAIPPNHLAFLKQESVLEPLHYHLTQFVHEGESLREQIEQKVQLFNKKLQSIIPEELTPEGLDGLINEIDSFQGLLLDSLDRINTALSVVWQTNRIDLIEKLSSINEMLQHQTTQLIGHSSFDHLPATGLYFTLQQRLATIFDSALKDSDSSLEGLTRLSIWHLKDYWELGLLPSIHHLEELDLDTTQYTEEERLAHHQHLISLVQKQLNHLHIGTVESLKKNYLFSKPLLKEYINRFS